MRLIPRDILIEKKLKFLIVGLLNTIFGYIVFSIFIYFDFSYVLAVFFATALGVLFNYFSYGAYVFLSEACPLMFLKFLASYLVVYCVNTSMLFFLSDNSLLNIYYSQLICIPFNVVLGWILLNNWVYKK